MHRLIFLLAFVIAAGSAAARPLFVDSFDPPHIDPLFPRAGNIYQLPPGPTTNRLQWLLTKFVPGASITDQEITDNFDASWLATNTIAQTRSFIESVRTSYPNAIVTDVVGVTPVRVTVVIDTPGSPAPSGFLQLGARYTGTQRIVLFGVSNYGGTVQYPEDRTLTLAQAADKFTTLSPAASLLVGRIGANGQCSTLAARNATTPRSTASIFKTWVMAGVARAIANGSVAAADGVPLVASELAQGGVINSEPLGTVFPVRDLAILMLGISDNTATDLLHQLVGREAIAPIVQATVANPDLMLPLLGVSEQFHLYRSFPLAESLSYVNGTQAFKNQFLQERIIPLGPNNGGPYFHTILLTTGSWRASPTDICQAFAWLRRLPQGSEAILTVDAAFGAQAAQPDVRSRWDRVWYKAGSLSSAAGYHVLTHAWMLENAGEDPYVVIAMSNNDNGGIDQYLVQSITGRMLELVSQM
ncbi:MAG: serine hydrolase [Xanthomonadales bacterium]|nr:serine hydrolase [Xanthomonadales bacterium]